VHWLAVKKSASDVSGICLGMAGVDRPEDKIKLEKWIREILPNPALKVKIDNDAIIALVSGTKKLHGIVVIAGTGSIVVGVNKGVVSRAGGWGPLLGDEGSGYLIGMNLLRAVCCAHDRNEKTVLLQATLKELNFQSATELIPWTYTQDKINSARYAALSPIVFKAAVENDAEALSILNTQASLLMQTIKTVHRNSKFSDENLTVVFSGGNLTHDNGNGIFAQIVRKKISEEFPKISIVLPQIPPQLAASMLALQEVQESH